MSQEKPSQEELDKMHGEALIENADRDAAKKRMNEVQEEAIKTDKRLDTPREDIMEEALKDANQRAGRIDDIKKAEVEAYKEENTRNFIQTNFKYFNDPDILSFNSLEYFDQRPVQFEFTKELIDVEMITNSIATISGGKASFQDGEGKVFSISKDGQYLYCFRNITNHYKNDAMCVDKIYRDDHDIESWIEHNYATEKDREIISSFK